MSVTRQRIFRIMRLAHQLTIIIIIIIIITEVVHLHPATPC